MSRPLFSIVVPTYNRRVLLEETLQSILKQTFSDFEVLVIDNCSTDGTEEFMLAFNDPRVRYFRNNRNQERAYSRNRGLSLAQGTFCTLLDSDDVMYPHCLQKANDFISANPDAMFFHGFYDIIDQHGAKIKDVRIEPITNAYQQLCEGNFISCIAVFVRTTLFERFKFSEDVNMIGSEDYEIWLRILAEYPVHRIESVMCGMREHRGRSVYTNMYANLEYQRRKVLSAIESDPVMNARFGLYLHLIDANYYYHQAMFQFHLGRVRQGWKFVVRTMAAQPSVVAKRRFAAMFKSLLCALRSKLKVAR